jgi:alkylation response protein AidB-like acyl-CoA dehydrogenase
VHDSPKIHQAIKQESVMSDLETFRAEARAWLEENCPAEMRTPAKGDEDVCWGGRNFVFQSEAQKLWLERCVAKGYTVPDWPKAYGGAGLSPQETKILRQEMAKLGCRSPLNSFGIWMLGPALLKFGTEEQKVHYMGQIARGEIRWCQGYSEPGSGSDLVSMQTFGEDKGDHWVVNGQKIWTSYADKADWIFCLVRTDKTNKYQGISFLLFDMETPGVSTKPIKLICPFPPAGAVDIASRAVANEMSKVLGQTVTVDEDYIRESILNPNAKTVAGYPSGVMPAYAGQLSDDEIKSIIEFIKTLK